MSKPNVIRIADVATDRVRLNQSWARLYNDPDLDAMFELGRITAIRTLAAYAALGRPPTVEDVDAIEPEALSDWCCDGCSATRVDLVTVGASAPYESTSAKICLDCARAAVAALEAEKITT